MAREDNFKITMALLGITPVAIGAFSTLLGRSFLWYRWYYFAEMLLSIPFAVGLLIIAWKNKSNSNRLLTPVFLFIIVAALMFLAIMNPAANDDNHIFCPNTGVRWAYTESELRAALFCLRISNSISADWDYINAVKKMEEISYESGSDRKFYTLDEALYNNKFVHDGVIKAIRKEIVNKPFRLFGGVYRLHYDPNIVLSLSGFDRIYDNFAVTVYLDSGARTPK